MADDERLEAPRKRQRWILPVLAVLFIGPLAAAWLMYFSDSGWRPGGQVNHGRLLAPVLNVPAISPAAEQQDAAPVFRDAWTLAVVGDDRCDVQCMEVVDKTRRVRLALREKAARVRRVLLYMPSQSQEPELVAEQDAGLTLISVQAAHGRESLNAFTSAGSAAAPAWAVYVVDPLGNVIMVFEPDFEMRGMLADLKRLLRLSRIG